ncbi:MAG: hypothetical protein HY665_06525 [Chloroflexi bacterium]|nr:hypothetical protein [Chloroflexota bacterium]
MPIEYSTRFARKYGRLPEAIRLKTDKALSFLNVDFRHPGLRSHPVKSMPGVFEAYVDVQYRMTFERRSDTFIMRNVDNHDECLKNP